MLAWLRSMKRADRARAHEYVAGQCTSLSDLPMRFRLILGYSVLNMSKLLMPRLVDVKLDLTLPGVGNLGAE